MRRKHQNDVKGAAKPHIKTMKGTKSNIKGNRRIKTSLRITAVQACCCSSN
jgi:hypothetical protein